MREREGRPKDPGFGGWIKRFFIGVLLLASGGLAFAQPVSVSPAPKRIAKPTDAMTFWGGYMWRQTMAQGVPRGDGTYSMQRGDFWGGRLVGGLGFGRVGFEMRWDIAGLKNQFDVNNPSTFKTLEAYAGAYVNVWGNGKIQIAPILVGGSITSLDENDYISKAWTGAGLNLGGGGIRLAGYGSEAHFLCVATKNFLYTDPASGGTVRGALVVHVRVTPQLYIVGDAISGADGFVRGGIAVRAF